MTSFSDKRRVEERSVPQIHVRIQSTDRPTGYNLATARPSPDLTRCRPEPPTHSHHSPAPLVDTVAVFSRPAYSLLSLSLPPIPQCSPGTSRSPISSPRYLDLGSHICHPITSYPPDLSSPNRHHDDRGLSSARQYVSSGVSRVTAIADNRFTAPAITAWPVEVEGPAAVGTPDSSRAVAPSHRKRALSRF